MPFPMAIAESVLLMACVANCANNGLRAGKSKDQLHDLAHGPVELLREVFLQVVVDDEYPDLAHTVRSIADMLLLLKGFLLGWDCSMCPDTLLELPLPVFPKHQSNRCWRWKEPRSQHLLSEVRASAAFICDHSDLFTTEPWIWIQKCLDGMEQTLFDDAN